MELGRGSGRARRPVLEAWRDFDLAGRDSPGCTRGRCIFATTRPPPAPPSSLFGKGRQYRDYGYFYIGYFAGGGIVINGSLFMAAAAMPERWARFRCPGPEAAPAS